MGSLLTLCGPQDVVMNLVEVDRDEQDQLPQVSPLPAGSGSSSWGEP